MPYRFNVFICVDKWGILIYNSPMNKTLIIFASPSLKGDTAKLVKLFRDNFHGEIEQINLFPHLSAKPIAACIDCRGCTRQTGCVLQDDFKEILKDDYNRVLIAAPLYMSNMPAPFWNLISRFNFVFGNKSGQHESIDFKAKRGALFLLGGGSECKKLMGQSNEDNAIKQAKYVCGKLNATLIEQDIVCYLNTDEAPVDKDKDTLQKVITIAKEFEK